MIEYRESKGGMTGDGKSLVGVVTPFNVWTSIGSREAGGWDERISPGAFSKTLQEQDPVLIDAHDTSKPMARMSVPDGVGSLSLIPDPAVGLRCVAVPVDTSYSRDVLACTAAGVTKGMSFGFQVIKDEWTDDEGRAATKYNGTKRTIQEVRLFEVTTTAFPAYPTTELSARDQTSALLEERARMKQSPGDQVLDAVAQLISAYNELSPEDRSKADLELRAAKATYSDLATCGECGSEGEYGSYCGSCGEPMSNTGDSDDAYCTSCGASIDDDRRSDHRCERRSPKPDGAGSVHSDDEEREADLDLGLQIQLATRSKSL